MSRVSRPSTVSAGCDRDCREPAEGGPAVELVRGSLGEKHRREKRALRERASVLGRRRLAPRLGPWDRDHWSDSVAESEGSEDLPTVESLPHWEGFVGWACWIEGSIANRGVCRIGEAPRRRTVDRRIYM